MLVVGAGGVGIETAKNLVLAGPGAVTIHDETPASIKDLGANFFLRPEHAAKGVRRGAAVIPFLKELNDDVKKVRSSRQWYEDHGEPTALIIVSP